MVEIQTILQGFSIITTQGGLGYCSVTLLRGEKITLVDVGHVGRRQLLIERVRAAGLEPEQIERIILTHAHWDHALNVDCFPNAEIVIHTNELDYVQNPNPLDWATPIWTQDVLRRSRIVPVRDGDEVERGVRIMATPGHSPGSQTVLVEAADGIIGLCGDALPNRAAVAWMGPRLVFWDAEEARASAQRIVDTCTTLYPGHDRPFRIQHGNLHYIEETSLDVLFIPRDDEGRPLGAFREDPMPYGAQIMPSARRTAATGDGNG